MPTRSYPFELKQLSERGEFSGIASVYGITDLGNDSVEAGAFSKSISDKGPSRTLLWRHDAPIGTVTLSDSPSALLVKGKLSMGVQAAREAYELLKDGAVKGLSIGFESIRERYDSSGIRHLLEIRLWEISLVPFPMLEQAQVTQVKSQDAARLRDALLEFKSGIFAAIERK